jgi:hypothetical protein
MTNEKIEKRLSEIRAEIETAGYVLEWDETDGARTYLDGEFSYNENLIPLLTEYDRLRGELDENADNWSGLPVKKQVNKSEYQVHQFLGGYWGICEKGQTGGVCVFGGDSANEDDYNEQYIQDVYAQWDGILTYAGEAYGYRIEL